MINLCFLGPYKSTESTMLKHISSNDPEWLGAHEVVSITLVGLFVLGTLLVVACYHINYIFKKCRRDNTLPVTISRGNLSIISVAVRDNETKFEKA